MKIKRLALHLMVSIVCVLIPLCIMFYPIVSNTLAEQNKSLVLTEYAKTVEAIDDNGLEQMLAAAQEYNASLIPGPQ
ncbi:MAG: hypothetical protein ACI3W7_03945 [Oscillospiraceae bacterium]